MLYPNQTVSDAESVMQGDVGNPEDPTDPAHFLASGGGFANYFPRPSWQDAAVKNYFEKYDPGYKYYETNENATNIGENDGLYNRAGRGIPDVSANGWRSVFVVNGSSEGVWSGTSLSAPIFASMATLINQQRTLANKSAIGFVNPVLYAHPEIFNDIVNGSGPNCGTPGFKAQPGWDPSTGLGTPNYPKMLDLFMSLP